MRFLSLALLSIASIAIAEGTWKDTVGDVPQCMKTCLNNFYKDAGLEDKCGSSDSATTDCLCGVKDSASEVQDAASSLSSCIQNGCDSSDLADAATQLSDFQDRFTELTNQCTSSESSKGAASSTVPGFNALLASGALLLVGAAM
ncbi:uncharacterized protein N7446_010338 [Penicillium canescens]|uniref:Extracellular membrane protein CFEM domain-containing protein n=1 Tax=Penicillium canescens TaxID=5083 RepID=A0AAD6I9M4_PENCN|nr:uncharacterized protein N7446_010338 [Penicillium canescens]KAJ6035576.1 hypothetical protein N7460_009751 [Penicillium canescens]KAJ6037699.1 hypothetical protein N7444_010404 [Penicillium canescens]KAJ6054326.1 hypothetical protein N7446_010338 [Penicillium canescens]